MLAKVELGKIENKREELNVDKTVSIITDDSERNLMQRNLNPVESEGESGSPGYGDRHTSVPDSINLMEESSDKAIEISKNLTNSDRNEQYISSPDIANNNPLISIKNQSNYLSIPVPDEHVIENKDSNERYSSRIKESKFESDAVVQKPIYAIIPDIIPLPDEGVDNTIHDTHNKKEVMATARDEDVNEILVEKLDSFTKNTEESTFETSSVKIGNEVIESIEIDIKEGPTINDSSLVIKPVSETSENQYPGQELNTLTKESQDKEPKSLTPNFLQRKRTSRSPSPSVHKASSSKRSRSPRSRRSKSYHSPEKSPSYRRNRSSNRSRSRSARRSDSRNKGRRRYSRSPNIRQRRSRSQPRYVPRGSRSFRYSGVRDRSRERRGPIQRRYGRSPPYRGRMRGRSASKRSDTRSRSRSITKKRHRRHQSTSSSSSSSSSSRSGSNKKKNEKSISKSRRKRSSSSSTTSSRSKRTGSDSP